MIVALDQKTVVIRQFTVAGVMCLTWTSLNANGKLDPVALWDVGDGLL